MIKLKTKTEVQIPTKRGIVSGIVHLIIERLEIDINNIRAKGYYYYIDQYQKVVKLDDINTLSQWVFIDSIEVNMLSALTDTVSLKANVMQRLNEFTILQLTTETGENYGTTPDDWEVDI